MSREVFGWFNFSGHLIELLLSPFPVVFLYRKMRVPVLWKCWANWRDDAKLLEKFLCLGL